MTQKPRSVRGYVAQLTSAVNLSPDGAYAQLDLSTAKAVRDLLLTYAQSIEKRNPVGPVLYILLWNFDHPLLKDVAKSLDPYLAVDLTDAMEQVLKALPETGTRETVAEIPGGFGEAHFMAKGRCIARAIPWQEMR